MSESFEESCAYATGRMVLQGGGRGDSTGTGFFYTAPYGNDGGSITLLISNRHVFGSADRTLQLKLNRKKGDGTPNFLEPLSVVQHGLEHIYFEHPDPRVDLACVNASELTHHGASFRPLSADFTSPPINLSTVHPGAGVIFVGYPDGLYDEKHNLPLIRRGSVASIASVDFCGRGEFVIDANVYKGSSGSPVFTAMDGTYKLLGVLSEFMVSKNQVRPVKLGNFQAPIETALGLGIVIKLRHVQELIDGAVAKYVESKSRSRRKRRPE